MLRLIFLVLLLAVGFYVVWPSYSGYRIYAGLNDKDPSALENQIDFPGVRASLREPVVQEVNERVTGLMKDLGAATGLVASQIPKERVTQIIDGALNTVVTPEQIIDIHAKGGNYAGAMRRAVMSEIDKLGGLNALLNIAGSPQGSEQNAGSNEQGAAPNSDTRGDQRGGATIGGFQVPGALGDLLKDKRVGKIVGELAGKIALDPNKLAGRLMPGLGDSRDTETSAGKPQRFSFSNIKNFGFTGPLGMRIGLARNADKETPDATVHIEFKDFDWRVTKLVPNLGGE